jgi:hypothetical protein
MRPGENNSGILLESKEEQRAVYTGAVLTRQKSILPFLRSTKCDMGVFRHINVDVVRAARHPSTHAIHDILSSPITEVSQILLPMEHSYAALTSLTRVSRMGSLAAKFYGVNPAEIQYVVDSYWIKHNPFNESVA